MVIHAGAASCSAPSVARRNGLRSRRYVRRVTVPDHISTTQAVYDATADAYATAIGTAVSAVIEGPVDRALLGAFVELVGSTPGTVADIGCGPGP